MDSARIHNGDSILVKTPFLTTADVAELFSRLYGTSKPVLVKELVGYYSQNFYVQHEPKHEAEDESSSNQSDDSITDLRSGNAITNDGYILKVLNTEASRDEIGINAIHSVQTYLNRHGYMCTSPLLNIHGDTMKVEEFNHVNSMGKREHGFFMVRAYPFIVGPTFDEIEPANSTQLLYEAGRKLAQMHQILQQYPYDIDPLVKRVQSSEWNFLRKDLILEKLDAVEDEDRRNLAIDVLNAANSELYSNADKMRSGVLHGDFSHTNLVLSEVNDIENRINTTSTSGIRRKTSYKLCGLIDFDESYYGCLVFDVGIAMAYISMSKAARDQPLRASATVLAGYQSLNPLTPLELKVLRVCQASRYVHSLVLGLHYHTLDPDNEYLLKSQTCWPSLEQLWSMDEVEVHTMWRDVAMECVKFEKSSCLKM